MTWVTFKWMMMMTFLEKQKKWTQWHSLWINLVKYFEIHLTNSTLGHCNLPVTSEGNDSIYLHYVYSMSQLLEMYSVLKITRAGDTLYAELVFLFYFCKQLSSNKFAVQNITLYFTMH